MHEIKLHGHRMAARIDHGNAQLLTRTGLDWMAKYPSVIAAVSQLRTKSRISTTSVVASTTPDCPALLKLKAATDGEREVRRVSTVEMSPRYCSSSARLCSSPWSQTIPAFRSRAMTQASANSS